MKSRLALSLLVVLLLLGTPACRLFSRNQVTPDPTVTHLPEPTSTSLPAMIPTNTPVLLPIRTSAAAGLLRQWGTASAASEYFDDGALAVGAPDELECEFFPSDTAWIYQGERAYPQAYLQIFYEQPVIPTQVNIHLVYYHSAIVTVSLIDLEGRPHVVYSGQPGPLDDCPAVLTVDIAAFRQPVYTVRLDLVTVDPEAWEVTAIDAVELVGKPLVITRPTPVPTPYLSMSSLGINPVAVPEGYTYFEVMDKNKNVRLYSSQSAKLSWLHDETTRFARLIGEDLGAEVWLYLPAELAVGKSIGMDSFSFPNPRIPSAQLWIYDRLIPLMDGWLSIDRVTETTLTGVVEFSGFDRTNNHDYYQVVAVFNQVPLYPDPPMGNWEMMLTYPDKAIASSELSPIENSAMTATGEWITTLNCESSTTAWKPLPASGREWVELYFAKPIVPAELSVVMTSNPGAVTAINVLTATEVIPLGLNTAFYSDGCPSEIIIKGFLGFPGIIGVQVLVEYQAGEPRPGVETVRVLGFPVADDR